jgi:hypothetical protein
MSHQSTPKAGFTRPRGVEISALAQRCLGLRHATQYETHPENTSTNTALALIKISAV